jgi:hypothetical protein
MVQSKCEMCGKLFGDPIPDAPLTVCCGCEQKMVREASVGSPNLSSDGGFHIRTSRGRKIGGPFVESDVDANALKDPD